MLLTKAELFQQITLAPSQPLKEYHSLLVKKGTRLGKSARDILLRFIAGLPQQLEFFVRDCGSMDHTSALTEALVGEAHGYRLMKSEPPIMSSTTPLVSTCRTSGLQTSSRGIATLQAQMVEPAQKTENTERPTRWDRPRQDRDKECLRLPNPTHWGAGSTGLLSQEAHDGPESPERCRNEAIGF